MSAIASSVIAHKFLLALAITSLTITGGAIAVGANTLGTMSFTVNSSVNVVSIANMNFGNLSPGQSSTFTSTAKVTMASGGNYTLFLENNELLNSVFSSFDVSVSGFPSTAPIILSLDHPWARFSASAGTYTLTVQVSLTVNGEIGHSMTVSSEPFLGLSTFPPYPIGPMPPVPVSPVPYQTH